MSLSDDDLVALRRLSDACEPEPWLAMVEGRDHESGDSFIMTGTSDKRGDDVYVTRGTVPADAGLLDLIAAARTYLPRLIDEVQRSRGV